MKFNPLPHPEDIEGLKQYASENFRRIQDVLDSTLAVVSDTETVTGTITVETTLEEVHEVQASLNGVPVANACYVRAFPVGLAAPKDITLEVYTNAFALSGIAKEVSWVAVGI